MTNSSLNSGADNQHANKKHRRLTHKEMALVRLKAQGATHAEAYRKVYSDKASYQTANANTIKTLRKPKVKAELERLLRAKDITITRALEPISKGLSATKQNDYTGEITDDLPTQLKASDRALKLLGVQASTNSSPSVHLHQHIHKELEEFEI